MQIPAESLSATSVRDKVVTATEAVRLIRDGDSVVVEGFVGQGFVAMACVFTFVSGGPAWLLISAGVVLAVNVGVLLVNVARA